jgi:hypothetical protein
MARSDVVGAVDSYAGSLHLPVSGVGFGQLSFWEIWGPAAGAGSIYIKPPLEMGGGRWPVFL